jgi:hypothetical protein
LLLAPPWIRRDTFLSLGLLFTKKKSKIIIYFFVCFRPEENYRAAFLENT